jgi:hypothetical protein
MADDQLDFQLTPVEYDPFDLSEQADMTFSMSPDGTEKWLRWNPATRSYADSSDVPAGRRAPAALGTSAGEQTSPRRRIRPSTEASTEPRQSHRCR